MRNKIKKVDKSIKNSENKEPPEKVERIKGYDYKAWDKFDVVSIYIILTFHVLKQKICFRMQNARN